MGATGPHFSAAELACKHCGENECSPRLVDALEYLRALVNVPITVDDAYRCKVHNAAVGGVPFSEHLLGLAADIRIEGMTPKQMYEFASIVTAFRRGGIGVAVHQGYIHVDVRERHARWCYNLHGQQSPWDVALDEAVNA